MRSQGPLAGLRIAEQTALDFDKLMGSREGVAAMAAYAAQEYADENVRFWMEVRRLKEDVAADDREEIVRSAAAIIDTYLHKDAEKLVNLPSQMLARFDKDSASGAYDYSASMFDDESEEIRKLIRNDTFARFRYSEAAEALLWELPMLGMERDMFKQAFSSEKAQEKIKPLLIEARELVGADRA